MELAEVPQPGDRLDVDDDAALREPRLESGNVSWVAASSGDITTSASYAPHAGSWYAWLGGWATAHTDSMYQT